MPDVLQSARGVARWAVLAVIVIAAIAGGIVLSGRGHEATDDAQVEGRITQISTRVGGPIAKVGVREVDPLTLEFRLRAPTPFFPAVLTAFTLMPVHRATMEKFGSFDRPNTPWTKPGNLVSNGPFMLKDWKPNQFISVVPNPHYWDRANVRLSEIRFFGVDSEDWDRRPAGAALAAARTPRSLSRVVRRSRRTSC